MKKNVQKKYVLLVYWFVFTLASAFLYAGIQKDWPKELPSTLINLGTELLGAVLVFAIVNRLFLFDEWNIAEQIKEFIPRMDKFLWSLETSESSAKYFFRKWPELGPLVSQANRIDLCGVFLETTINRQINLRKRLEAGATVRILIIDPDSVALQMYAARESTTQPVGNLADGDLINSARVRVEQVLKDVDKFYKDWEYTKRTPLGGSQGSLSVRLLQYAPSIGIIGFNVGQENSSLFIEVYPHKSLENSHKPSFILTPNQEKDGEWYNYFVEQFDLMWESAKPWDSKQKSNTEHNSNTGHKSNVEWVEDDN